jgi:hypothetical protein
MKEFSFDILPVIMSQFVGNNNDRFGLIHLGIIIILTLGVDPQNKAVGCGGCGIRAWGGTKV